MATATDVLRREHRMILVMARILDEMTVRYEAGEAPLPQEVTGVVNFFLRFADHLHHAKEEKVLFPAIVRHDPASIDTLERLLEDHQTMRATLYELSQAVAKGDRAAYFTAAHGYLRLIRVHIERENTTVLPLADRLIVAGEQEALAQKIAVIQDEQLPDYEHDALNAFHRELSGRYFPV